MILKHVNIYFVVTFSIIFMMVVFTLSTIIHVVVILYMKSSTPGRFRHPWFGGVTNSPVVGDTDELKR